MTKLKKFVIDPEAIVTELKKIFIDQQVNIPKSWRKDSLIVIKQEVNFYTDEKIEDVQFKNIMELLDILLGSLPDGINKSEVIHQLLMVYALRKSNGVAVKAADILGISKRMMAHWVEKYNLKDLKFLENKLENYKEISDDRK